RMPFVAAVTSPVLVLALVAPLMVFLAAFFRPMVDRQALLVFVPYLLIVLAAGTRELIRIKIVAAPLVVALVSLFSASTWYFHVTPSSPRDYAAIARLINARLKTEDVVFVRPRKWYVTPLFYYLDASHLIAKDYATYTAQRPQARVWVVLFER